MEKGKNFIRFIVSVGICELVGVLGALYTTPNIGTWYVFLAKPALTPPAWVFGPVWTILYFLTGVALFLVWSSFAKASEGREKGNTRTAIGIFVIQLILNILWSIIFFGSQSSFPGFIAIVSLWLAVIATIMAFGKISRAAAWILVPYLFWVTFAGYLNFAIWLLNR